MARIAESMWEPREKSLERKNERVCTQVSASIADVEANSVESKIIYEPPVHKYVKYIYYTPVYMCVCRA